MNRPTNGKERRRIKEKEMQLTSHKDCINNDRSFISSHELFASPSSDLTLSSHGEHDFKLLENLVHQDSIRMHDSGVHSSRQRRDTTAEDEKMLKKNPTKKPTNLIKQKATSLIPFKSTIATSSPPTSSSSASHSSSHSDIDSEHHAPPLVTDGNSFFAPEDVTLPPNSTSNVS